MTKSSLLLLKYLNSLSYSLIFLPFVINFFLLVSSLSAVRGLGEKGISSPHKLALLRRLEGLVEGLNSFSKQGRKRSCGNLFFSCKIASH